MSLEAGRCAKCGSEDIEYGVSWPEGESLAYPYHCNECGHDGIEWYDMLYNKST